MTVPAHEVIHAITHQTRWDILQVLDGDMTSTEIAEALDLKPNNVTYHLNILMECDLLDVVGDPGHRRKRYYRRKPMYCQIDIDMDGESQVVAFVEEQSGDQPLVATDSEE